MSINTYNNKITCSIKEFADRIGVSLPTAYAMTEEPGFPLFRVGRRKLVIMSDVERWLDERGSAKQCSSFQSETVDVLSSFMSCLSLDAYLAVAKISKQLNVDYDRVGAALIEYALSCVGLEEYISRRFTPCIPNINKLTSNQQEGANNEQVHSTAVHA